jgi:ribosome maturation factor RimP
MNTDVSLRQKVINWKGTESFPSAFLKIMSSETNLETVKSILESLLEGDIFLVDMKVKPTNNIKIYLDADTGLGIEKCIKINRALYKVMEEMEIYPDGDFSLEVSSPGIDEPLKMHRQYLKNIGRNIEVSYLDGQKKEGQLKQVNEESIEIEYTEGKGKKAVTHNVDIPFSQIKQTKVLIKF